MEEAKMSSFGQCDEKSISQPSSTLSPDQVVALVPRCPGHLGIMRTPNIPGICKPLISNLLNGGSYGRRKINARNNRKGKPHVWRYL